MEFKQLKLPEKSVSISEEEMRNIDGGSVKLGMTKGFLDKDYCMYWAIKVIDHKSLVGMTYQQAAEEIYAHAVVYYMYDKLPDVIKNTGVAKEIYQSAADGIDLEDYGDTLVRRVAYNRIWNLL